MIAKHLSQKLTTGCWVFRWVPGALTPFTPYAVAKNQKQNGVRTIQFVEGEEGIGH